MAESPQHPLQIMENQTRFDLNAAVKNWRQELAAQPPLTSDNRRELETHLRDALAELKARGLSDEESFWLARRRVGQPQQLGEEFVKADPAKVWRERVFWMLNAFLLLNLWRQLAGSMLARYLNGDMRHFMPWHLKDTLPDWFLFYLPRWLGEFPDIPTAYLFNGFSDLVPVFCCFVFLSSVRLQTGTKLFGCIFPSRTRFLLLGLSLVFAVKFASVFASSGGASGMSMTRMFFMGLFDPWTFSLLGLIAWLLPAQNRKTLKRA